MKKVFLFIAAAALSFSLNSCSKDAVVSTVEAIVTNGTLNFKIDGTAKSFKTVNSKTTDSGITILATNGVDETATFGTTGFDKTGADVYDKVSFMYKLGDVYYNDTNSNLTFDVTENSSKDKTLKGTFSGTVLDNKGASHNITGGTFNLKY